MKKIKIILTLMLLLLLFCGVNADEKTSGRKIFEKAKVNLFDRNWSAALKDINEYIKEYPYDEFYKKALFYRGKCHEELKNYKKALESYELYSKNSDNKNLNEAAIIAIIDISFKLSKKQGHRYLTKISDFLNSSVKIIRYYAAIKLSHTKNKKDSRKAVSVLKNILKFEEDVELVNRAKLALMRIDPKYLKLEKKRDDIGNKNLHIVIYDKKKKKETLSLSIPFMLAKMALQALQDEERKILKDEGYTVDSILEEIVSSGELLKFEVEDVIIKIWIE